LKISSMGNRTPGGEKVFDTGLREGNLSREVDFQKTLLLVNEQKQQEDLQRLIQEVDRCGAKLSKSCTLIDLRDYKRAVKNFLKETLGKSYSAENKTGRDRMGRHRIYLLVKKVEESLEELSQEVLSKQKDQLAILKKIDEIRGLLVDIYM